MSRLAVLPVALLPAPVSMSCAGEGDSQPARRGAPRSGPASASLAVLAPPIPVHAEGAAHLVYEVHVSDLSDPDLEVTAFDVYDGDIGDEALLSYTGYDLGGNAEKTLERVLGSAQETYVIYVWITLPPQAVPDALVHRVVLEDVEGTRTAIEGARVEVGHEQPVVLGPPLRGPDWVAGNGPANWTAHRRALYDVNGVERIAQRFATDWVRTDPALPIGPSSETYTGDPRMNASHFAYGAEVLAVADGVVVAARDGLPDEPPGAREVDPIPETLAGNYVVLDVGGGRFAFYGHLQRRSIRVQPGDVVTMGAVLGLVGSSGYSSKPHLHFHVADAPSPLDAEGLPYVFRSFDSGGRADDWTFASAPSTFSGVREMEMPLYNTIVRFAVAEAARVTERR